MPLAAMEGVVKRSRRVEKFVDGLLRTFVIPFGPVLIERAYSGGLFREADVPVLWAIIVVCFMVGQAIGGLFRWRIGPPVHRARLMLCLFLALIASVVWTGWSADFRGLMISRFLAGLCSVALWRRHEQAAGAAAIAATGAYGAGLSGFTGTHAGDARRSSRKGTGGEQGPGRGPVVDPLWCLGAAFGGLIGGVSFPRSIFTIVKGRPALLPSILAASVVAVPALGALLLFMATSSSSRSFAKRGPTFISSSRPASVDVPTTSNSIALEHLPRPAHPEHAPSSSGTETGDATLSQSVPENFVLACGGDRARARKRYDETLAWRRANSVDKILEEPQPHFSDIKKYYPHYLHGKTLRGEIVVYEFPGRMDLGKLKSLGVGAAEIGRHYLFFNEFMGQRLGRGDDTRVMTVLDIGGLGITNLTKDVLDVLRTTSEVMTNTYPERVTRILVINVPMFLGSAWKVICSVLPKAVQDRIHLSSDTLKDLQRHIALTDIPATFGGESGLGLGDSEEEQAMRKLVEQLSHTSTLASEQAPPHASAELCVSVRASQPPPGSSQHKTQAAPQHQAERGSWWRRGSKKPVQAHLGYENRFVYDQQRQMWVLGEEQQLTAATDTRPWTDSSAPLLQGPGDAVSGREEKPASKLDDPAEVEEHGLILAIQAAHYAERLKREEDKQLASLKVHGGTLSMPRTNESVPASSSPKDRQHVHRPPAYLVAEMFILYGTWEGTAQALEAVLPAWMCCDHGMGGSGAQSLSIGLIIVLMSFGFLGFKLFSPSRWSTMARVSPLRAFRLGAGLLVASAMLLCFHPDLSHGPASILVHAFYATALFLLVAAVQLGRHSAAVLLRMVAPSTHDEGDNLVKVGAFAGRLPTPFFASGILAWSILARTPYPLDARLVLLAVAAVALCLYISSLSLQVSVVGDWGRGRVDERMALPCLDFLLVPVDDACELLHGSLPRRSWSLPVLAKMR